MKNRYKIAVTYSIVTEESARHGDYSESGFEAEEYRGTLRDLFNELDNRFGTCFENFDPNGTHSQSLYQVDPSIDYSSGEERCECVHVRQADKRFKYSKRSMHWLNYSIKRYLNKNK